MYRTIKRNPLGIRKLDVQAARRQAHKDHREEAKRLFAFWFEDSRYAKELTPESVTRFAEVLLSMGWEKGVTVGATATRGRVAEALDRGTLVKPDPPVES